MKLTLYKNKNELIIFYIIISFILFILPFFIMGDNTRIQWIGIFSLVIGVLTEIIYILISNKIVTFSNIYLICLYVFHFGQVIINGVNPNHVYRNLDLVSVLGNDEYLAATSFSLAFYIICAIIIFLCEARCDVDQNDGIDSNSIESKSNQNLLPLGLIITCISFPINLRINLRAVEATMQGGYLDSFEIGTSGVQSAVSSFLIIGIVLLMLSFSSSKAKTLIVYILSVLYYSWTMLSGGRGAAVISILFLTYIFLKITKVTIWKLIVFLALAVIAMGALSSIAMLRNSGGITLDKISQTSSSISNPLVSMLEETGGTLQTVGLSIRWAKSNLIKFGLTYLESLLSILPNMGSGFNEINKEAIFTLYLPGSYLGGSVIGEAFYNFGYAGAFMGIPVGLIIGKMSNKIDYFIEKKDYLKIAYYIMPCYEALWWVRDCFSSMCRSTVWAIIILYLLNILINSISYSFKNNFYNDKCVR